MTVLQPNVTLTGIYSLPVTNKEQTPFHSANQCQGQLQTPQSVSVCIYQTARHHVPGYSKSSVTAIRTSKHTTLYIFLWKEFHINSSPVSLLYLSSVNCQNKSELTGYGPMLHNVSNNSSPSRSIMGHDITVQEPGCNVMEGGGGTAHLFHSKYKLLYQYVFMPSLTKYIGDKTKKFYL
jgi:hypothetical protein